LGIDELEELCLRPQYEVPVLYVFIESFFDKREEVILIS